MRSYNTAIAATVPTNPSAAAPSIAMNATFNSFGLQCYNLFGYSIQIVVTGTPTGYFKLQCSDDPVPQGSVSDPLTGGAPTNWTDVDSSTKSVSAAGNLTYNITDVGYTWARLVYTDTSSPSSTATFAARFNGKGA